MRLKKQIMQAKQVKNQQIQGTQARKVNNPSFRDKSFATNSSNLEGSVVEVFGDISYRKSDLQSESDGQWEAERAV